MTNADTTSAAPMSGDRALATALRNPKVVATLVATAERLRRLRMERGLRLADVAALSGLSEAHLYRIESAERWPSLPALLSLAAAYGIDASVLLKEPHLPDRVTLHSAGAIWEGDEANGAGLMFKEDVRIGYTLASRTTDSDTRSDDDGRLGSPEELIGMAFAGCFSMSLAERLASGGFAPRRIETFAEVRLARSEQQIAISEIRLNCDADVDGVDEGRFDEIAQITKRSCVVSRALAAVPVVLEAHLADRGDAQS